jgi:hypothetical protein
MWAFAKSHQFRGDLLLSVAVLESSLSSPDADTPIRRPADTFPLPVAHFQRNPPGRGRLAVFPSGGHRTRSTVMNQIAALYRQSGSDRLEKQPTDLRRNPRDLTDGALGLLSKMNKLR